MNIIITGAGKGIGYELTKKFAESADNKVIAISREIKNLLLINENRNVVPISFDLGRIHDEVSELTERIGREIDRLDILINNAGILVKGDFDNFDLGSAKTMFNINFFAPALLIRELLPLFRNEGRSHIINIGSMGGYQDSVKFRGLALYSASKAALAVLSECLAVEFEERKIACNCLALGSAQTEMFETAFPEYIASASPEQMAEYIYDFSLNGQINNNGKVIPVVFKDF